MVSFVEVPYEARGAAEELFWCRDPEILLEGPAGTGKTRAVLELIYALCNTFPGIRVLFLRKTRASLTESVLVTWEQKVLPDEACVTGTAAAENRRSYTFPWATNLVDGVTYSGRSHIVLGGMDKASRVMSTEYDVICVFEANEITEAEWEALLTRNRNFKMPWQLAIADTNPDSDQHWLNRRASKPYVVPEELEDYLEPARSGQTQMTRLLSRHRDNPFLWNHERQRWSRAGAIYMRKLHALTGPRRARLLNGEWAGAEGQVWEEWDRARHMVYLTHLNDRTGKPVQDGHPRDSEGRLKVDWYMGSMDFGFRNAGVLQIWGVVGQFERLYRIHEVYQTRRQLDWWAEAVCKYDSMYELQAVVCDPSRPENIETLNQRLGDQRGRRMAYVAQEANNAKEAGLDMVRYGLDPGASLRRHERPGDPEVRIPPRLFLCWDALEGRDRELDEAYLPCCTEEEIPGYVWKTTQDGKQIKEETDPLCADHGCDAMRYAAMFAWGRDLTPEMKKPTFEPGTMGFVLDHDDVRFDDDPEAWWRRAA